MMKLNLFVLPWMLGLAAAPGYALAEQAPTSLDGATLRLELSNGEHRVFHLRSLANMGGQLFYLPCEGLPESEMEGVPGAKLTYFSYAASGAQVHISYSYQTGKAAAETVHMRGSSSYHESYARGEGIPAVGKLRADGPSSFTGTLSGTEWRGTGKAEWTSQQVKMSVRFEQGADSTYTPWQPQEPAPAEDATRVRTRMQALAFTQDGSLDADFVNWLVESRLKQFVATEEEMAECAELYHESVENIDAQAKVKSQTPVAMGLLMREFASTYPKRGAEIHEVGIKDNQVEISVVYALHPASNPNVSLGAGVRIRLRVRPDGRVDGQLVKMEGKSHPPLSPGFVPFSYQGQRAFITL